jgi:hypothetical protein
MKRWQRFRTFKQRGEWVELKFMEEAAARGYPVLKPWGDSLAYDVGIDHAGGTIRVQVKSTIVRNGTGYFCQFRRNYLAKHPYTVDELDLFAAYIIPEDVWYLIPATVILTPTRKVGVTLCPMTALRKNRYRYEQYRDAWNLLGKSREELATGSQARRHTANYKPILSS